MNFCEIYGLLRRVPRLAMTANAPKIHAFKSLQNLITYKLWIATRFFQNRSQ